ncbi:hypothetical protein ACFWPP_08370 [Streptomyces anulatus]|uniref:hypothetical protein n=1 Tax=Streptomyces anulatus TaxID=1892 RepID=UPI00365C79E3
MNNAANELTSIRRTRKVVNSTLWFIVLGAVFYSLMTSTPLVAAYSHWAWSGWALGALTDAAFILSISADAVLSKHGLKGGKWATGFRWVTGVASLFLNTWSSVAIGAWVGVAIHSIAPVILICAAEVAPVYRRKFRDLELALTEQVTEVKVTQVIARPRKVTDQVHSSKVAGSQVTAKVTPEFTQVTTEVTGSSANELTVNQQAIRDGFMNDRKASEVAVQTGLSSSYVSRQYRRIREELELTA